VSGDRTPRQVSLARLVEFGIVPKRSLGQNFLVDDNIIRVILQRLAPLPEDVAIEVGAGLGILTRALAQAVGRVHAFEIDRSLAPALEVTLADPEVAERVLLQYGDIMKVSLESLDPLPTLCASNLPYSVAAPFLGEALERLPSVRRYCLMMQREVAERLAAPSGGKDYGSLSVWVRLHTRIVEVRALSRTIFHPQPNVDSSLVTLERAPIDPLVIERPILLRAVVEGAFSQRRKLAVNALAAALDVPKESLGEVFRLAGVSPQVRAEAVEPPGFVALARGLMELGLDDRYNEARGRSGRTGSSRR